MISQKKAGSSKLNYFLLYTIVVCALFYLVYFLSVQGTEHTFIWYYDGIEQHYKVLLYFRRYILEILDSIKSGALVIPQWEFNMGEGGDIISTFNYMVMSPLSLLSIFFSEDKLYICYDLIYYLRYFIAGIGFSLMSFEFGRKKHLPVLLGAVTYVFCGWCIYCAVRHPNYLIGYAYMPFFICFTERIIKGKSPLPLALACFLCSVTNFYWYFNVAVFTVIYAFTRVICLYRKDFKTIIRKILQIGLPAIIGTLMSFVIFLPVISYALGDTRAANSHDIYLFFENIYYQKAIKGFLTITNEREFVFHPFIPCIFSYILLFKDIFIGKGKDPAKKTLFVLSIAALCITIFPVFSSILNGLDYPSGKWCWALHLLLSFIFVFYFERLLSLTAVEKAIMFSASVIFGTLYYIFYGTFKNAWIVAAGLMAILLIFGSWKHIRKVAIAGIILLITLNLFESAISIFNCVAVDNEYGVSINCTSSEEYGRTSIISATYNDDAHFIKEISSGEDETVRYSGRLLGRNGNIIASVSSSEFYWSLSNPDNIRFRELSEIPYQKCCFKYEAFDERTRLTALDSIKYYLVPHDNGTVPYGFEKVSSNIQLNTSIPETIYLFGTFVEAPDYDLYVNKNYLPYAYSYSTTTQEKYLDTSDPVSLESAMFSAAITEEATPLEKSSIVSNITVENPGVTYSDPELVKEDGIVLNEGDTEIVHLDFEGKPRCETYLRIINPEFDDVKKGEKYFPGKQIGRSAENSALSIITALASNGVEKKTYLASRNFIHYHEGNAITLCLGYSDEPITGIDLLLDASGIYGFEGYEIYYQPIEGYEEQIEVLKEDDIETHLTTDTITAGASFETDKMVVFTCPYSKHWTATIDGEPAKTYKVNYHHIGVLVGPGEHQIVLRYNNKLFCYGAIVSVFGLLALIGYMILFNNKNKRKDTIHD